jgi:hypothetical protein
MSDIDWSILTNSMSRPLDPVTAMHYGNVDRAQQAQEDLAAQKQAYAQQAAQALAQANALAGQQYAAGNTRDAQGTLIGAGNVDALNGVTTADTQQFKQTQDGLTAAAGFGKYLVEHVPDPSARSALIRNNAAQLVAAGVHPDHLAEIAADPSDNMLDAAIGLVTSPTQQNADAVAQQNANSTAQNAETTRMGEIRQENTPVGIATTDNVYVPGGATAPSGGDTFSRMVGVESNGRQLDPQGQPLTSAKGATGIAQMLPSTAQDAARMMGVAFDPRRFATDASYNRKLGQTYFDFLLNRYGGDETKAVAAYNGGLGRVDAAVSAHGSNWLAAMPAETRRYVAAVQPGQSGSHGPTLIASGTPKADPNAIDPDDPAIAMAARQYAATGDMPALGNGNGPMRRAILRQAAQIVSANRWTPAQIAANKATVKAATTALAADNRMYDTIQTAEQTALANGQRYIDLAAQMPGNTSSTWYNSVRNGIGAEFSDKRVTDANTAYQTFIGEYNRVVNSTPSGSGTLTDASRREAQDTFSNATSPEAKRSAFEVMKADMAARRQAQQAIIDRRTAIIANVGQSPSSAPQQTASNVPSGAVYVGTSRKTGRPVYRLPNGQQVLG